MAEIVVYRDGGCLARACGKGEVNLLFMEQYQPGDEIAFTTDTPQARIKADACVEAARVYLPALSFRYRVPFAADGLAPYPPGAFQGERHLLSIAPDTENERRNLAVNPLDQRHASNAYPHASANVETRGESVFFARNVIDGLTIADGHGVWPYQSWGIGAREDVWLMLDFGRDVIADEAILYLRADFPHDAFWTQARLALSDGDTTTFALRRMDGPQTVEFGLHTLRWIRLEGLVKSDDPSAFPALRQLMVMGRDA
ncbi:MAG: carbohydrate-binding protein [Eubacteriales bacterium]|nr:carbohydrate-binding protein [Eubacteriales bacterium]